MPSETDRPGVLVFPPVLVGGTLLANLLLQSLVPWRLGLPGPVRMTAAILGLAAAGFMGLCGVRTMHRVGTHVNVMKPTTAIATTGPFRFTRNPLYVSLLGLYLALAIGYDSIWPFLLVVPMFVVLDLGVVRREERYLEAKFGEPYRAYKARVRRWL